jgi:hypothetical protein
MGRPVVESVTEPRIIPVPCADNEAAENKAMPRARALKRIERKRFMRLTAKGR